MGQCPLCTSKKGNIIITDIILSQNDPIIHTNTNNIRINLAEVAHYNNITQNTNKLSVTRPFAKLPSNKSKNRNINNKNNILLSAEKIQKLLKY